MFNHSIIFEDVSTGESYNSLDDWHLIPDKLPVITPPAQKQKFLDIPGANGHLDMSETLTGYPVFDNRTGSLDFIVMNDYDGIDVSETEWTERFTRIMEFLHGKIIKIVLTDDPGYYYLGRLTVSKLEGGEDNSLLSISYSLDPFKWKLLNTTEDWLWDPFDFENDFIDTDVYSNISVESPNEYTTYEFDKEAELYAPVIPIFDVSSMDVSFSMRFINPSLDIDVTYPLSLGENEFMDCIITNTANWKMMIKGTGTLSIKYRKGRL